MSRINHNIPSLIAVRHLTTNNTSLNTSLQRLATGMKINAAKDNPAGLIASENLRAEKNAIQQAINNSTRANNILATTEGALNEVNSLLLDIQAKVTEAANKGGMSDAEIKANQLAVDSAISSVNRIARNTQFQGIQLLNGNFQFATSGVTTSTITDLSVNLAQISTGDTYLPVKVDIVSSAQGAQLRYSGTTTGTGTTTIRIAGVKGSEVFSFASGTATSAVAFAINQAVDVTGVSATMSGTAGMYLSSETIGADAFVGVDVLAGTFSVQDGDYANRDEGVDPTVTVNGAVADSDGQTVTVRTSTLDLQLQLDRDFAQSTSDATFYVIAGGGATFQITQEVDSGGQITIGLPAIFDSNLGGASGKLSSLKTGGTNQLSSDSLSTAQNIVEEAISQISTLRGRLGAIQANTLDTNINSLNVALENASAAESAIRDTDFAEETANLTRNQIMVQAASAVLRTANAMPQNVLALLG
jgi:flagellin